MKPAPVKLSASSLLGDLASHVEALGILELAAVYSFGAWHGRAAYAIDVGVTTTSAGVAVCRAREQATMLEAVIAAVRMVRDERAGERPRPRPRTAAAARQRKGAAHG